ncbi:MAG: hypothetical protein QOD77_2037 [Thermoplasmata archaeon]|jgi:hypothetical protein|nr:hypothetical protein [Thermoplasmata archaeon]
MQRLWALLVAVGVGVLGLAMGAELQHETALHPDAAVAMDYSRDLATGYVLPWTALVVVGGTLAVAVVLRRRAPGRPRQALALLVLAFGAYVLVNLAQGAYPEIVRVEHDDVQQATLSVSLLAADAPSPSIPSALVPVFALWVGALLAIGWAARRLAGRPPSSARPPPGLEAVLRRQAGATLLAVPFLGIAAWGCVRMLLQLPEGAAQAPYMAVLPVAALAILGFVACAALKLATLARAVRAPRLAPLALDAWRGLGRAETGLWGVLLLLGAGVAFLPSTPLAELQSGWSFGTHLRPHLQLLVLLAIPMAPLLVVHREGRAALQAARDTDPAAPVPPWLWAAAGGLALSLAGAGLANLQGASTLTGWVFATLPAALATFALGRTGLGVRGAAILVAAFACWCLGNSFAASFVSSKALLQVHNNPNIRALWRLLGATLAGLAIARLLLAKARARRASLIPMAAGAAFAMVVVVLVEMPLHIWTDSTRFGQSVAVGSWMARQDFAVRVVLHTLALACAVGGTWMAVKLLRPEPPARPEPATEAEPAAMAS